MEWFVQRVTPGRCAGTASPRIPLVALLVGSLAAACSETDDAAFVDDETNVSGCGDGVCDPEEEGGCLADCSQGDASNCGPNARVLDATGVNFASWEYTWDGEDGGYSLLNEPVVIAVPADATAVSVSIEQAGVTTGFDRVTFNNVVVATSYEEDALTVFSGDAEVASFLMPNNERTRLTEGCLVVQPYANGSFSGESFTVTVGMRRGAPGSRLNLNIAVLTGTEVSDEQINAAIEVVNDVYTGTGAPAIGDVTIYEIDGPTVVEAEGTELNEIRATAYDDPDRMNILLVSAFTESGTLGIASGIPAPPFSGTAASGLVVAIDEHLLADGSSLDTQLLGETIAHELGHMMGLYHTTESEGTEYDVIADTPRCPPEADDGDGEFTAEECRDFDGENLMFWVAGDFSQTQLTPMQVEVLRANPVSQ